MTETALNQVGPMAILAALVLGYFFGSIPFGLLLTKLTGHGDIRSIGSGNIGATNVLRTGNKKLAAATLLLDVLKGTAAVLIVSYFNKDLALIAGFSVFIGHIYPVWLGFKGGKGVATYLGILIGLAWPVALIFIAVWIVVALLTRFSSLSALIATIVAPLSLYMQGEGKTALLFALLTLIIFYTHRTNIQRLINGTESKIGEKNSSKAGQ